MKFIVIHGEIEVEKQNVIHGEIEVEKQNMGHVHSRNEKKAHISFLMWSPQ